MRKNLPFLITICSVAGIIFGSALLSETGLTANNAGAPSMRTGSPGDTKSCTTCHTGTAQNATGIMSSDVPVSGYVPGATYTISSLCVDASKNRFGFEISPQNLSGAKLGTITITDVTRTKLIGSGKYITHTSAGTSGTGSISWSFDWTAPPAGSGDVTFYGAFNFSNHNNASSGDLIKLSTLTVHEDVTLAVNSISLSNNFQIYPNPSTEKIQFTLPQNTEVNKVRIYNSTGMLVRIVDNESLRSGSEINVSTFPSGTYYVSFATGNTEVSRKFIKQ